MLQDADKFDVESWMIDILSGTEFPVILCIHSCRVDSTALDGGTCQELKSTTLEVPSNIFLSWGSASGELVVEGDFVKFWRYKIQSDFMKKDISAVAKEVLVECKGGRNYSGLDARRGMCKGGVWEKRGHLGPTNITPEREQAAIEKCIAFALRALGKNFNDITDIACEDNWKSSGVLQGKKVVVAAGKSIAVLFCHDQNKLVHGIAYVETAGYNVQTVVQSLNRIQITEDTSKSFSSIEAFLHTTERYEKKEKLEAVVSKKTWFGGR